MSDFIKPKFVAVGDVSVSDSEGHLVEIECRDTTYFLQDTDGDWKWDVTYEYIPGEDIDLAIPTSKDYLDFFVKEFSPERIKRILQGRIEICQKATKRGESASQDMNGTSRNLKKQFDLANGTVIHSELIKNDEPNSYSYFCYKTDSSKTVVEDGLFFNGLTHSTVYRDYIYGMGTYFSLDLPKPE